MMKDRYDKMFNQVSASEALIEKTIDAAKSRRRISLKWTGAAAAACAACMLVSIPVLAAHLPSIQEMLGRIDPFIAEKFGPESYSCESAGIRLTVGDISTSGNVTEAELILKDLTGGQLAADTALIDHSVLPLSLIDQGTVAICHIETTSFQPETQTLTARLHIEFAGSHTMTPEDLMTLSVSSLLSGRKEWCEALTDADLSAARTDAVWTDARLEKYAQQGSETYVIPEDTDPEMLAPVTACPLAEDLTLTAVGFLDGQLHIQVRYDALQMEHYGLLWLQNAQGERLNPAGCQCAYLMEKPAGVTYQPNTSDCYYEEYVFDVTEEELAEWQLWGSASKYTKRIDGDWKVTFAVTE